MNKNERVLMKGSLCLGEETPALRGRNEINERVEKEKKLVEFRLVAEVVSIVWLDKFGNIQILVTS